jgi:hypothetical protein
VQRRDQFIKQWLTFAMTFAVVSTSCFWLAVAAHSGPLYITWTALMVPRGLVYLTLVLVAGLALSFTGAADMVPIWVATMGTTVALLLGGLFQGFLWRLALLGLVRACRRLRHSGRTTSCT